MYKCEICGTVSPPRTPAHKVVLETRSTSYAFRPKANACWKRKGDTRKYVKIDDPGGRGRERAREVIACAACAAKFAADSH